MTNPYIDMLQAAPAAAPGGEPPANPYLDMLQSADEQRRQQMAGQLTQAVGVNPEQYTAQRRVAQYLGYPTPVVEAQPHLMGQAKVRQIQQDTANAPVLQRKYTDADFAKLAHDDAPILSKIETAVSSAVRYAMGADQYGGMWGDLKRGAWDNSVIGTAGAFRMVSELGASAAELVPAVRSLEASGQYGGNPLRRLAEGFAMIGANQQALKDASSPPAEGNIAGGVSSGFQSAGQNLKYLPLAFLGPAGWAAGLTGMVVESGGTTYQKDREEGVPMGTATIHAAADGLAEYVGERYFGEVGFLKRLAAGAPATKLLMWEITRDVPGEIGTTLWQNFNDWALTNPSKTADQFLREQPDAIVQTAIGALVGGGVQVGVGKLAMRTAETVLNRQMEVTETLQREESLKALMQLAGQAKLAERSPEQLQAFVAEASGDATVRFDAATLVDVFKQDANALAQALPSVDLQALQEAAATGGEVTVPLAELVVGVKAAGVDQTVLEHARLGDSTLSAAEARDVQSRMDGELGAQVAQAIAQAQDQDAARQSHEAVRSNIEQQIIATGRHRPAVAEQMATWAASFFTTYGSRLGITAEEMYQRYPLRVLGAPTARGGDVMGQGRPSMTEDEYIQRINPEGRRIPEGDRPVEYAADMEGMLGPGIRASALGTHRVKGGLSVKIVLDSVGGVFALHKGQVVGYMAGGDSETQLSVAQEYQGKGIGSLLSRYYRTRNPFALSGGLTEGGERAARSAYRYMVANGLFDPPGQPSASAALNQPAFHGTPYRGIEKFSTDKIGTGEGAQAYGWGLYFASKREIAEWYRENLPGGTRQDGAAQKWEAATYSEALAEARLKGAGSYAKAIANAERYLNTAIDSRNAEEAERETGILEALRSMQSRGVSEQGGQLYEVEIPEDSDMLLWDRPLSEQPAKVREALDALARGDDVNAQVTRARLEDNDHGADLYKSLTADVEDRDVSEALAAAGIKGIKYLDGTSRNAGDGTFNYVIFSGDDVQIRNQFYQGQESARGTFSPQTLELVLNPNANLSTWFHETGHFFLEVLADVASQPNAPAQIVEDMNTFLKWAGITGDESVGGPDAGGELAQADDRDTVYKEIAADEEVVEALEAWMVDGAPPNKPVNDKLLAYMRRLPPVPSDSYLTFYRGQPRGVSPHPRGWASWTTNKDETRFFTEGNGEVLTRKGVRGISLEEVALWRTRATGQLHDYGSQGEWLVLNESVFNQDGQPAASAPPITPKRTPLKTWNAMTLDQKRPYHERWAESVEQYVMEGRAPSVELQPLMRRFAAWLKSVYGSIKQFLASRGQAQAGGEVLGQGAGGQTQTEAFREWFDGSRAVDEDGRPVVVYHGSNSDIEVFKTDGRGKTSGTGAFFTDDRRVANTYPEQTGGGNVTPVFLSLKNPLVVDARGANWNDIGEDATVEVDPDGFSDDLASVMGFNYETDGGASTDDIARYARDNGYDGAIIKGVRDRGPNSTSRDAYESDIYVAFNPEQIKSAIGNDGTFDADDPSILSQGPTAQPGPQMALNDDIRRVMDRMLATDEQIAQANEVAGLVPDEAADGEAAERLRKRSIADLKWAVKARDKALAKLRKAAKGIEKEVRAQVTEEVNQRPEVQAKDALDKLRADKALGDASMAATADAFGFESPDAMLKAIAAFGSKAEAIDGMTEQRMLEEHGDLVDERAIAAAANEAVHNEARARSLATELRTQSEMLNARADTGQTNAKGSKVTVNVLMEAAKQFGANVAARTPLADVRAAIWRHTQAERRAAKRWQEATAGGKTEEAVKAKQDQMLQHAATRALTEAQAEIRKTLEFFKRVATGNDETVVKKGRDADIVNAARAVLAAYGVETPTTKRADDYLDVIKQNDPETYAAIAPMVDEATRNAQPLRALTVGELQALSEQIGALWYLAKRSRQMEIGGDLLDIDDLATQLNGRMEEIGIPDTVPGEAQAVTKREARALFIRQGLSFLKRVEQWAEGMDGRYGGPFLRYVFQPIKAAADAYRADRTAYRKKLEALVSNLAPIVGDKTIDAPELGYTFGGPDSTKGVAMNEVLHALLHTGNESNKRKLLLGRQWAAENADGTLDTSRWDSFIQRLVATGKLQREHFDFVQGVWDLLEETKPLAQKAHRDAFGRYFAEVTAAPFVDPFGVPRKGGYVPAMVDPALVKDNALRKIAEAENESMSYAFPQPGKGFTMSRVEGYNRALMLDLRTIGQHLDKVLLFSHMTVPARSVRRLVTHKAVSQPLDRIDPTALEVMLQPWLQRSAQQVVETPIPGSGGWARVPSIIRARAGMALMFANVSNAIQQATGLSTAMVKVKPGFIMRAMAQHVAHPVKAAAAVWEASSYMNDRAKNEVAVLNENMRDILLDPSPYEKAQAWSQRHAYFLQTAIDNALSPIVWTGAYNQAMSDGMTHDDAVAFADGTVRQTQGSTLPEDVSRFETGPAYARAFTQFIGYFNMVANTNVVAIKQIAGEMGLKRGAGRLFSVVMVGMMIPIWAAEAIAQAFKGGPDDEDKDGLLIDDWLAAVFGFGTAKGLLAMVPIVGQAANSAVTRLDNNPMNDRISLSPGLSLIESAAGGNVQTVAELFNPDKDVNARRAVRDAASLVSIATGLPLYAIARPAGYAAGVAQGKIEPTGPVDAARGLITGTPSPESKVR